MRDDNPAPFVSRINREIRSHLKLYFSLVISLTVCSAQPPPTPFLQHDGQSIARQSGLWCCSHFHRAKKEKKKIFDKIWWLAQVVCFTGLLVLRVRAANKICVCVCLPTVYDGVFTPGLVLWSCDAECHPAPAWALQPEKPAVKLTALSSALTYTLSSPAHTPMHTHTCNHTHMVKHTYGHTHTFMAWGLSTHAHTSSPHIHTQYPQTITQAAGSLSHAS